MVAKKMGDNHHNIFEVLESPSTTKTLKISSSSTTTLSLRRSHLPLINAGSASQSSSSSSKSPMVDTSSSSLDEPSKKKRRDRALQDLGFVNPGPKNLVNVANVPPRRLKTRQSSAQEKTISTSSNKPLYDKSGCLIADGTDRCDCNRLTCPGCFLPCSSCQSAKCGLECRNLRAYVYEYRLYGTNKEIVHQQ